MKYLVVLLVVALVVWLMLRDRKVRRPAEQKGKGGQAPQAMLQCSHCGVHLPRAEALVDVRGAFCSEAHRLAGPRAR